MIKLKSPGQIDKIRESCRLLISTLKHISKMIAPGVSTLDLDLEAQKIISSYNASPAFLGYMGFPAALCTSINNEVIHGIPSKRKLKNGDILGIDCGLEYNGFFSDMAFTFPIGSIDKEVSNFLERTRESLYLGISQAVHGNRVNDISKAIYNHNKKYGYGVVRPYCGHGVGLALHEEPQVPNYVGRGPNPRLKSGMVLAIEPMINMGIDDVEVLDDDWTVVTKDGSLSAHFEHTIAILDGQTEILTNWDSEE